MHGLDHAHPHVWVTEDRAPQGGDFVRDVSLGFNCVTADPERDQQAGYICTRALVGDTAFVANLAQSIGSDYSVYQFSKNVEFLFEQYAFSIEKEGNVFLAKVLSQVSSSFTQAVVASLTSSFWRMAQFNPGVLPHWLNTFSDLYAYDVFSGFTIYNRLLILFLGTVGARIGQYDTFSSSGNIVQTDYYATISNDQDVCTGDEEPPFITYVEPTISGAHVRPRDQLVEFTLTDAVGGVDISSVYVSLNSQTTSGTIELVAAGADQTGGDVAVIGDSSSYRFRYVPPFLWDYNDIVTVTVSGADLPSQVGGNPFFCGDAAVNFFSGDIPFQVLNEEDLGATLTAIGDVDPPYFSLQSPASGTVGNSIFSPVTIYVADDLTGVDLASLIINIGSETIVNNGVPTSAETVVGGTPSEYRVVHTPETAFTYGSTATVSVYAEDLVQLGPANQFSAIYDFSFIEDSTLVIENFRPEVGTHHNVETVDIQVDVRDDTFGVDEEQTFFVINGALVSGTVTTITSGIQMTYHPPNDFEFDEPIRVTVHGTNDNAVAPVVKEVFHTLFYGCRILYFNDDPLAHADSIDVFVRARNVETFYKDLTSGYFFSTYTQPSTDMGASIEAVNPQADLSATLNGLGPEHRYGETVTVEFSVEDLDGHLLGPYIFVYTIEDRPD